MVNHWLGQCYYASVVKNDGGEALRIFKDRIEADQNLKKEAQQRLAQIDNIQVTSKCFVSKKHVEFLRSVLT